MTIIIGNILLPLGSGNAQNYNSYHRKLLKVPFLPQGMLAFKVPNSVSWGHLFSVMERLKCGDVSSNAESSHSTPVSLVEDYAASDTSLEQVFLSFAREASVTGGIPEVTTL